MKGENCFVGGEGKEGVSAGVGKIGLKRSDW